MSINTIIHDKPEKLTFGHMPINQSQHKYIKEKTITFERTTTDFATYEKNKNSVRTQRAKGLQLYCRKETKLNRVNKI